MTSGSPTPLLFPVADPPRPSTGTVPARSAPRRIHAFAEFPIDRVAAEKGDRRVSVCIPARNEAATIASVLHVVRTTLMGDDGRRPLVDELLVVDDHSTDATREVARLAGAHVVSARGPVHGKGQAMQQAAEHATGDILVFLDADVTNTGPHFVSGLLGPLVTDDGVALVKGFYERPLGDDPAGGGRVTELVARPLIDVLFPELSDIRQPLAGETAAQRWVFEKIDLADGYGVELGLLIDVAARFGPETIAQVDLGVRAHRNRPLGELRPQATDVLRAALDRAHHPRPR